MKDCLSGNSTRISDLTVEGLIGESGASPENVRLVLDKIVMPEFKHWRLSQENGARTSNPVASGTWGYTVVHADDAKVELVAQVFGTEREGRVALLQLLKHAWRLRYVRVHGELPKTPALDWYEGVRQDRTFLESTGVRGSINPITLKLTTWAQMEERFKMFASAQPSPAQD